MKIVMSNDELDDFIDVFGVEGFKNMADDYETVIEVYKSNNLVYNFIPELDPKTLSYEHA
jgi:hypothetical protein